MTRLAEAARAMLPQLEDAKSLEQLWLKAAVETVAMSQLIEPPIAKLKGLTIPTQIWSSLPLWPMEVMQDRIRCLIDTHRLAIVHDDLGWLKQLDRCWEAAPGVIDELRRLRAEGEIGLGLRPGGRRPYGWTADELWLLTEESFLVSSAPADCVWRALAERDLDVARHALKVFEARMADVARRWDATPKDGLRELQSYPGTALQVELRALRVLIERTDTRGW